MTTDPILKCQDEQRRQAVHENEKFNGLDYLEVGEDPRTLTVYFLGKAPEMADGVEKIKKENVLIEGGRRIRDIRVVGIRVHREDDPDGDDRMEIVVDKQGDSSTYT